MVILGIDPGSRVTGFGVIKIQDNKIYYVASGCIRITEEATANRLKQIADGITQVINTYAPTESAIEQIFMFQNPGGALKLGQARGVAMCTLAINNLEVSEYSAKQVKQAVVGNGGAAKSQIQHMVQSLLGLSKKPPEDAADALAIAICHYHSSKSLARMTGAKKIVHGRLK
ncbi:crossover junction endodeoxyribonuclease RuvC [Francisella adeliensis]|uniref:Crossover junction endodeoxyribonuclease RuvC n=1 Tax=Francisella adeliensis TaxID=2007306 RepID=A0A2Z4XZE7_9GAMM|nr:crossover junction endodeoxyribonuclease RuvC [Francisella adeliensis]AXA34046.1 crossover junction endodeoxyribonuclease RuvC [Francisella adeliensis]MBK2085209.1 crossover junction endodeoxyribonuclease RuvC [Francisella adeliensis]MBK2096023.1 crossover junction endodeoxyribonuclease RuvC [Francisella adeliensis]QIW12285.1 crossover junction endodeoxyribonuclease RuvC [Francisella adeliensis]QIW14160.1 crossover junction endodeoxyribonuclease RuvC [Francisella adeliensis]